MELFIPGNRRDRFEIAGLPETPVTVQGVLIGRSPARP